MRGLLALALLALSPATQAACDTDGTFAVGASKIELAFHDADYSLSRRDICAWANRGAAAVNTYYGRFPVPALHIVLKPADGAGVSGGTTYGQSRHEMPLIVVQLGKKAGPDALARDWVLAHELVHLATPEVPDESHWLEEGVATYVEPIARVQAGELTAEKIWGDMRADMWKGTPAAGDAGLDRTHTWGRTYWGGALFCLLADVEIRKRTGNRKGLQDALRGVLAAGGSIERRWSLAQIFAAGDAATGVPALAELYARMKDAPGPGTKELDALWKDLGVVKTGEREVRFDEAAPLAGIRRGITGRG